jgi:hypothetical protein
MTKTFWKSKTLWFNVLTALVFVATYFFGYQPSDATTHTLTEVVTNPLFITAINFGLRFITKAPLSTAPAQLPTIDSLP